MRFAQFFIHSTGYVEGSIPPRFDSAHVKPVPALGTEGVLRMDGRFSDYTCVNLARQACRKRGYIGFTINAGPSFSNSRVTRAYEAI